MAVMENNGTSASELGGGIVPAVVVDVLDPAPASDPICIENERGGIMQIAKVTTAMTEKRGWGRCVCEMG